MDARRETKHGEFCDVFTILCHDESVVAPCLGHARRLREKATQADDAFWKLPSFFGKTPKDFVAAWLSSRSKRLTSDWLDSMEILGVKFLHGSG